MTEIQDLIDAFQVHYGGLEYTSYQATELINKYGWIRGGFKTAVYDEVVATHPMALRSLPDIAVIELAMQKMDRPETYAEPVLSLVAPMDIDNKPKDHDVWLGFLARIGSELGDREKIHGEMNHFERERFRGRVKHNDATIEQQWWIHVIDDLGGKGEAMPEDWAGIVKVAAQ